MFKNFKIREPEVCESLQVRLQDTAADEKMDLHKFAPCKYVAKM